MNDKTYMNDNESKTETETRPFDALVMPLLIWWTTEDDCIFDWHTENYTQLPDYVWDEYRDRLGRNGRGRLWVSKKFDLKGLDVDPNSELWRDERNLGDCAGIVFKREHLDNLRLFPGYITDLKLKEV